MTITTEKDRERARGLLFGQAQRLADGYSGGTVDAIATALSDAREEGRREGAEAAESRARQAEAEVARLLVAARDVLSGRPGCIFVLAQAVADTKGQP